MLVMVLTGLGFTFVGGKKRNEEE
ncbi:hypothetical protein [Lacticaseibacillus camelliae]